MDIVITALIVALFYLVIFRNPPAHTVTTLWVGALSLCLLLFIIHATSTLQINVRGTVL